MAHYLLNDKLNGIEIYFDSKPEETVRTEMKSVGFRWSQRQGMWYARQSETTLALAKKLGEQGKGVVRPVKPETVTCPKKANQCKQFDYPVNVGDLFYDIYGYDATLYDFYEVVALRGTKQVVLCPVSASKKQTGFCSYEVKPLKGKYLKGTGYKTRLLSGADETIVRTITQNGSEIRAGKLFSGSWDRVYHEDNYH